MPASHAKPSSLFIGSFSLDPPTRPKSPAPRSPRSFDNGAVGLGIVAALFGPGFGGSPGRSAPAPAPIPIVSSRPVASWVKPISMEEEEEEEEEEAMELSERYTYVISHGGGKPVSKRAYFDGGSGDGDGGCGGDPRVLVEPLQPVAWPLPPPVLNFLSRCYLCRKDLHGLDIFMYSGDKAFCSVDCRSQQILSDERMEKCGSEAMMQPHFDCSLSPCTAPLFLAAGVAAA